MIISSKFPFEFVTCESTFISICIFFLRAHCTAPTINCIAKWHYSISIEAKLNNIVDIVISQNKRVFDIGEMRINRAHNQIIFWKIYICVLFIVPIFDFSFFFFAIIFRFHSKNRTLEKVISCIILLQSNSICHTVFISID